jgi:Spy/CpxP family protein refolding chaperone
MGTNDRAARRNVSVPKAPSHDKESIMKRLASSLAAAAAVAVIGISGAVFAQPHHGHRGGMGGGGDVVMAIAHLKSQLNLNTSQQVMWDNAVAASKAAHENARASRQAVHDTLKSELAKAEPDLAAVAAAADNARDAGAAAHRQVRTAWLNLYGTFTPEQKGVVKNALQQRLSRMEQFREKMKERRGS